ncbi:MULTISPECIES: hypothetical protein [Pseudomonas]|uniref:Uncharacterized protein n=1 Tax=Pseudomonas serboccidentalis TaxID=2964670 RepID=A0ABY7ZI64_9PSED|nr:MULTISPECIES: hypothetical protein [Pseudomonas]MBT9268614.1 hypothetical protein [Pseudomonas sp. MG-9]WDR38915.1 hypothetical protein NN484_10470 [Pseudomonas serboccidentalis]
MIAVHVVEVRKGWHSHAGPGSGASHIFCGDDERLPLESAEHLGQVRQNQQQRRGEKNEPCLTNFRLFEHGLTAFIVIS